MPGNLVVPVLLVKPLTFRLLPTPLTCLIAVACTDAPLPQSPRSDVRNVEVQHSDDKPDFVKLEREGDATVGLAAAYLHGSPMVVSSAIASIVRDRLRATGYEATVTPTSGAVLVGLSLPETPRTGAVVAIRSALAAGHAGARMVDPSTMGGGFASAPCGEGGASGPPRAPNRANTTLAAVGDASRLGELQSDYEQSAAWPGDEDVSFALPAGDEFVASSGGTPAELVVGIRTPDRQRVVPAARLVGQPGSLLSLVAGSHPGGWQMLSSHGSFTPGGGCLSVRLLAKQAVPTLHAARAAKSVARELLWVLDEQVTDEDPRFNVLEAPSAEEAAQRAAWEAITNRGHDASSPTSLYVAYRGPDVEPASWRSLLEAESEPAPMTRFTRDEHGQGRVWALLSSGCAVHQEDNSTAGHTAAALLAAAHSVTSSSVDLYGSPDQMGLVSWEPTRDPGAEDRAAESLARSILQVLATPSVANQVVRNSEAYLDRPPWTLALTLATNAHPSWLSLRSTPQSRALFDADALRRAMRQFLGAPLQLAVLTNQGPAQAERLNARLSHLLSGVYGKDARCPDVSEPSANMAGEYDVESAGPLEAVLLYVVDRRYSESVRHLAFALNQPNGWLSRAIEPLGANAIALGLGAPSTMAALGITLTAREPAALSDAVAQTRTLISELPKAPAGSFSFPPAAVPRTPVERLAESVRSGSAKVNGEERVTPAGSVRELISDGLTERRLFVVRSIAPARGADSSVSK